jgi:CheY-like chemotaxis protein
MSGLPRDLLEGWQIAVIEDEPDNLEVAQFILEFYGATVHAAGDGGEGYDLISSINPDLIISDLSMPVVDGWEMLHRLRSNPETAEIPIIALTAHAMTGDRERVLDAGFNSYITKPLTAETFIDQLVQLLLAIPSLSDRLNV